MKILLGIHLLYKILNTPLVKYNGIFTDLFFNRCCLIKNKLPGGIFYVAPSPLLCMHYLSKSSPLSILYLYTHRSFIYE